MADERAFIEHEDLYAEPEVHLREYWYVVLKHRWRVAAVAVTVFALSLVGTLIQTPRYRSMALVQIDRGKINLVQDVMVEDTRMGYQEFYGTQQRVLKSRTLARRVMDELDLWSHRLFSVEDGEETARALREKQMDRFLEMVEVSPVRNTQLVEVILESPDPELSARMANALVAQYIAYNAEAESGLARDTVTFIREQITKLQQDIQQKETLLQEFSQREDLVMMDENENVSVQGLADLNRELTQVKGERAAAEAEYRSLERADASSYPEVLNNRNIQELKRELSALEKEHAELSSRFGPEWPEMRRTRGAMEEVRRGLEQETREVRGKVLAAARVKYQAALGRERLLEQALGQQRQETRELGTVAAEYNRVKVQLDSQRAMLENLLRRQGETGLSADLEERKPVDVRVVEDAVVPNEPYKPKILLNLSLGAFIGITLGLGLAFFLNYWNRSIYTVEDLRRQAPLPYLGMIPRYDPEKELPGSPRRALAARAGWTKESQETALTWTAKDLQVPADSELAVTHAKSELIERLKFLRSSLLLSSPGGAPRTLVVTSCAEGEGKTFIGCHLAASLAELGKQVLLVDADLRRPRLHRIFRMRDGVGLTSALTGQKAIDDGCIYRTSFPNLFVLLAGPRSPSPAELLGSSAMNEVLERCAERFDFVLLDTAPLLPVVDTHALLSRCDAALLVGRSGRTDGSAIRNSLEIVERARGKLTGVVLNDVDLSDYAQHYYHTYYSYQYDAYSNRPEKG